MNAPLPISRVDIALGRLLVCLRGLDEVGELQVDEDDEDEAHWEGELQRETTAKAA